MNSSSFSIRARIVATVAVLCASMLIAGGLGLHGMSGIIDDLDSMYQRRVMVMGELGELRAQELDRQTLVAMTVLATDPKDVARFKAARKEGKARATELLDQFADKQRTEAGKKTASDAIAAHEALQAAIDEVDAALAANDRVRAARVILEKVDPAFDVVNAAMDRAVKHQFKRAQEGLDDARAGFSSSRAISISAMLAGLALAVASAMFLLRAIMSGLNSAVNVAERIAEGQLGQQLDTARGDEFGVLLGALKRMDEKLHQIVGNVRDASDAVGGAAAQLSRGNDDLSQRTQEQASALEQTASSMEEMTATVKQNADNARQANQLASGARGQAERGGEVVTRAIGAMEEINSASRKIADIISVIDEIAFQTNLLALNAAVESARAGEQGRGFAVVASEVRSLAQRSAAAAKEIKDLIGDSVEKVRTGSELVDRSGKVLGEIMESVKRVSDIVAEISAASEEQAQGIEQVNNAVTQMDDTTQQNAALVEEAASAAKSMEQQAQALAEQISFFRSQHGAASIQHASSVGSTKQSAVVKALPRSTVSGPAAHAAARSASMVPHAAGSNHDRPRTTRSRPVALHAVASRSTQAERVAPIARASGDDAAWEEF